MCTGFVLEKMIFGSSVSAGNPLFPVCSPSMMKARAEMGLGNRRNRLCERSLQCRRFPCVHELWRYNSTRDRVDQPPCCFRTPFRLYPSLFPVWWRSLGQNKLDRSPKYACIAGYCELFETKFSAWTYKTAYSQCFYVFSYFFKFLPFLNFFVPVCLGFVLGSYC